MKPEEIKKQSEQIDNILKLIDYSRMTGQSLQLEDEDKKVVEKSLSLLKIQINLFQPSPHNKKITT